MRDIPYADHTLGLELTSTSLKGAEVSVRKKKPNIIRVFSIKIESSPSEPNVVKPLYNEEAKQSFDKLIKNTLVVTALDTSDALARKLELDLVKEKDIDAVLEFQTEPLLPDPLEEGVIDRVIVEQQEEGSVLTVVAARKDFIAKHLEKWRSIDIEPELVSCVPVALAEFSKTFCSADGPHLIAHFGEESCTFIIANKGRLISAQAIPMGISGLLGAYARDLNSEPDKVMDAFSQLDFAALNQQKLPQLAQAVEAMHLEVVKVSYSLIKKIREYEVTDLFTTGIGAILPNLAQKMYQTMKITHLETTMDPDFNCSIEVLHRYALSIGAALTGLSLAENSVNFRQDEYAYPHPWKRVQKPLIIYFGLCFALAFAFYLFGNAYISRQEDKIKSEYVNLLESMRKPYSQFEKEYLDGTTKGKQSTEESVVNVILLSQPEIIQRLDFLNKELNATPDIFPLLPNIPKVSDVLAWMTQLSTNVLSSDSPEAVDSPIQLTSFSYKVTKRPEFSKKKEVYQVKVELEFTTNAPKNAREFHDALIAPNDFIDPNGEIKWNSERGKYRISFYLKDKTYYPSRGSSGV
jgi:type IV pilus assembly protein PilM